MAIAAGLSAVVYLAAGLTRAYLVADDFQWLLSAETFEWGALLPMGRDHFYRPAALLWFSGATKLCGEAAGCYHTLNIGLHAANVALVYALVRWLAGRSVPAFAAALLFGLQPAFVQAVAWVSAATGLLATAGFLLALICQTRAWRAPIRASLWHGAAVIAFALAVLSHEAAATLPAVSLLMVWMFRPAEARRSPRVLYAGFALVLIALAVSAVVANRENYVFREGHYAVGAHMFRNALDYVVSLWIGPHTLWSYLVTIAGIAALLVAHPLARFGALWILITLVPYAAFTWGNVGRYSYLPAIGLAIALTGVLMRLSMTRRAAAIAAAIALAVLVRFAGFTFKAARGDAAVPEPVRTYVTHLRAIGATPVNGVLEVPAPTSPHVDRQYLETMLRWVYRDPGLRVVVR
jgi:hypothetical protein